MAVLNAWNTSLSGVCFFENFEGGILEAHGSCFSLKIRLKKSEKRPLKSAVKTITRPIRVLSSCTLTLTIKSDTRVSLCQGLYLYFPVYCSSYWCISASLARLVLYHYLFLSPSEILDLIRSHDFVTHELERHYQGAPEVPAGAANR